MGKQQEAKRKRRLNARYGNGEATIPPTSQELQRNYVGLYNELAKRHNDLLYQLDVAESQVKAIEAMANITIVSRFLMPTIGFVAIERWLSVLKEASAELKAKTIKHGRDPQDIHLAEFWRRVDEVTDAAERTIDTDNPNYDGGEYLQELSEKHLGARVAELAKQGLSE